MPALLVIRSNHFDHLWRRGWKKRIRENGELLASYADLERWYFEDNLALADAIPDYKFEAECTLALREFLSVRPDALPRLRELAGEGRFIVTSAGETICDSNLVLGETLVRNWLIGLRYLEKTLGVLSPQAIRNDAFGNSAQLPQILRGFGLKWATGLGYSPVLGRYWKGLDGSVVCTATMPIGQWGGDTRKLRPCPHCHGEGCEKCGGRGVAPDPIEPHEFLWPTHEEQGRPPVMEPASAEAQATEGAEHHFGQQVAPFKDCDTAQYRFTPEELLPGEPGPLLAWFERMGRDFTMRWALSDEAAGFLEKWFARLDDPDPAQVHPEPECNPNNTGCYVTRIRTKQTLRALEHATLRTEALAALAGRPAAALEPVWHGILFGAFHDAVTGTSVDPAVAELHEILDRAEADRRRLEADILRGLSTPDPDAVTLLNASGLPVTARVTIPDTGGRDVVLDGKKLPVVSRGADATEVVASLPAFTAATAALVVSESSASRPLPAPVLENDAFRVSADASGILEIFDKRLGLPVFSALGSAWRVAAPFIERDSGSPWATHHPDRRRVALPLALAAAEQIGDAQRLVFTFSHPQRLSGNCDVLADGRLTVTLAPGLDRVEFSLECDWAAHAERLRIAFPTGRRGRSLYGIPYGHLERGPYTPRTSDTAWDAANGDWPAVDWAALEAHGHTAGVLTRGLASFATEFDERGNAAFLLSVLRSPELPSYLHCRGNDGTTQYHGMLDHGRHRFEFALASHAGRVADGDLPTQAGAFNGGLLACPGRATLPAAPRLTGDGVHISALKPAEDGNGIVLRLCETRGTAATATVRLPAPFTHAARVDLDERHPQPLAITEGATTLELRAWEIATLLIARPAPPSSP